ncbi:MAG TPA: hypothetical protein VIL47_06885 [Candidatus Bipolaricaulota bacterium]
MGRWLVCLAVLMGLVIGTCRPLWAQPELGVPFTYDCIVWKEEFDPLKARVQRALFTAIGSVVFAGVVAVVDLKEMLKLPFDPKLVVIGFFGLGFTVSLADYWFTNERIMAMESQGIDLGCIPAESGL